MFRALLLVGALLLIPASPLIVGLSAAHDRPPAELDSPEALSQPPVQMPKFLVNAPGDLHLVESIVLASPVGSGLDGQDIVIIVGGVLWLKEGIEIQAGSGTPGLDAEGFGQTVAGSGGRGGSINIQAQGLIADQAVIRAGDGGTGGSAKAWGDPDAAAFAGRGGDGGTVIIEVSFLIAQGLRTEGGNPGAGGDAVAQGQSAICSGDDGQEQSRTGEDGGLEEDGQSVESRGSDADCGPVDGRGGQGGAAFAYGGTGGTSYLGDGGTGGRADAIGGRSGHGSDACFDGTSQTQHPQVSHAGHGGFFSEYHAVGGTGGAAVGPLSGIGGMGGAAYGETHEGRGGNASHPIMPGMAGSWKQNGMYEIQGGAGGSGYNGGGDGATGSLQMNGNPSGGACPVHETTPVPSMVGVAAVVLAMLTKMNRGRKRQTIQD